MTLTHWTPEDLASRVDEVLSVYAEAMGYPPEVARMRHGFVVSHSQREGLRAVAVTAADDRLLGFGYGYLGGPGQWWHDQVGEWLTPEAYRRWMSDVFELVELQVRPEAQGRGLGARLLTELLGDAPGSTVVLSTPEADEAKSRAWRLYRRTGFVDLARHRLFPGDDRPFAILGREL
ncbi:GNAT family N-acetyltransferase [Phytomonospora endophytica]|uniref:Ribosomal protein S18 acetylase RimI-like enzyme n=1 Tax=Phytomonospora endophytica TaxID=714109 RepID=A0A841FD31_9ACTN|nr:GNAT family N-acetyltransferase [Phytomonospora endophytica]MBB6033714.1 ribosomal protein S18 acetylase RimI-like enzyme [Phytomonospora endophytica]GIG64768.1 acetyltransferase [Phytomonospora endophytica]